MMLSNPTQPEDDDETDQLASDLDTPVASSVALSTPAASLRNELVYARRKATQLKLHPYQHDTVDEFVKVMYYFQSSLQMFLTI
jgi:hypothetical protein